MILPIIIIIIIIIIDYVQNFNYAVEFGCEIGLPLEGKNRGCGCSRIGWRGRHVVVRGRK
jgi:hypothetical protein